MQKAKHLINPQVYKGPNYIGLHHSPSMCKPSRLYGVAYLSRPSKFGNWEHFAKKPSCIVNGTAYSTIYKQKHELNIMWNNHFHADLPINSVN